MSYIITYTQEGCRLILSPFRRRVSERPRRYIVCWRLQPQCRDERGRWRFVSPRLMRFCCIAHFSYCKRRDPTRNLVADGASCVPYEKPVVCCGDFWHCVDEIWKGILELTGRACEEAESNCLLKCFGVPAEEYGEFIALRDIEYCCYHRCDERWRCMRGVCTFQHSPPPEVEFEEARRV